VNTTWAILVKGIFLILTAIVIHNKINPNVATRMQKSWAMLEQKNWSEAISEILKE